MLGEPSARPPPCASRLSRTDRRRPRARHSSHGMGPRRVEEFRSGTARRANPRAFPHRTVFRRRPSGFRFRARRFVSEAPLAAGGRRVMLDAVSVIVPTFHREVLLREALDSVLVQDGVELEALVADDTPEASARTVVSAFSDPRVRFLHLESSAGYVSRVRNAAARHAHYPLAVFLDDDDLLEPHALLMLAKALSSHPDAALAFGRMVPFGPEGTRLDHERRYWERAAARARLVAGARSFAAHMLFEDAMLASSGVMVRLEPFRAAGGFDESLRIWEDGECFLRLGRQGGIVFVDAPVARRRVGHPSLVTDLDGRAEIAAAYRYWYASYRKRFGTFDFACLRVSRMFARHFLKSELH